MSNYKGSVAVHTVCVVLQFTSIYTTLCDLFKLIYRHLLSCRGPALAGVHGFHTGKRDAGDSVGDGWRMKDTDSSSGAIIPTLFWGRLGLYTFFFRL